VDIPACPSMRVMAKWVRVWSATSNQSQGSSKIGFDVSAGWASPSSHGLVGWLHSAALQVKVRLGVGVRVRVRAQGDWIPTHHPIASRDT
jgi:hypothetical protein